MKSMRRLLRLLRSKLNKSKIRWPRQESSIRPWPKGAYDFGFYQCQNLVKKLLPEDDISKVTLKITIDMGLEGEPKPSVKVSKEQAKKADWDVIEVTIAEPILVVPLAVTEVPSTKVVSAESPTIEAAKEPKQIEEEIAPKNSNTHIVIL